MGKIGEKYFSELIEVLQNQKVKEINSQFIVSSIVHDIAVNFLNFEKLFHDFWVLWDINTKELWDTVYQL